jgi:hypothetical protein
MNDVPFLFLPIFIELILSQTAEFVKKFYLEEGKSLGGCIDIFGVLWYVKLEYLRGSD